MSFGTDRHSIARNRQTPDISVSQKVHDDTDSPAHGLTHWLIPSTSARLAGHVDVLQLSLQHIHNRTDSYSTH